jgi:hypothetical protein
MFINSFLEFVHLRPCKHSLEVFARNKELPLNPKKHERHEEDLEADVLDWMYQHSAVGAYSICRFRDEESRLCFWIKCNYNAAPGVVDCGWDQDAMEAGDHAVQ